MNLEATFNAVIVKPLEEVETKSGGIILSAAAKEKPSQGEVISVGPGKKLESGDLVPVNVKAGDTVIFGQYGGNEVKLDGEDYLILSESDILAKVKKVVDVGSILESTEVTKAEKKELSNIKLEDNE